VLPLVYRFEDEFKVIGTAFVINSAAGLLVTARHVVEELYGDLNNYDGSDVQKDLFASYLARNVDGTFAGVLSVRQIFANDTDVVILRVEVPARKNQEGRFESLLRSFPLEFSPPLIGAKCLAMGYDCDNRWLPFINSMELTLSLKLSSGFVRTALKDERAYPLFRISAEVRGGLSGGPVINEHGFVIGIVSTGMDLGDGGEPISWISHSSALLSIRVESTSGNPDYFYYLVKEGGATTSEFFARIDAELVAGGFRLLIPPVAV
jgi:S1-C subfamily serine protease